MLDIDVEITGLPEVLDALDDLDKPSHEGVEVGIVKKARYEKKGNRPAVFVATVGAWLEWGTEHIKARRWFRRTLPEIEGIATDTMVRVLDTDDLSINRRVAAVIGERAVDALQRSITRLHLIDTGHFRRNISWAWRQRADRAH